VDKPSPNSLGAWGEAEAAQFLADQGLRVIDHDFRQKWGEIDLIARDGSAWVFVEVKTRWSFHDPSAVEAVTRTKQRRIIRAALGYMKWKHLEGVPLRFDLVLIESGQIEWIRDAFEPPPYYTY
jgi:putative endonuclease